MKVLLLLLLSMLCTQGHAFDPSQIPRDWPHRDGKHFQVIYPLGGDTSLANDVLNKAEEFYDRISDRIGFARYEDFWTWEKRVKIILYPDATTFSQQTGQPSWSEGFSSSHAGFLGKRVIVSFLNQPQFLTAILPHEIGHLILHDFMQNRQIPVFFDEGVAQLEQPRDDVTHRPVLASLIRQQQHIPLRILLTLRPSARFDGLAISIFYAESLYIVDFLIKTYGKEDFEHLCRQLRDGVDFESALKKVYYPTLTSLEDLEEQWAQSLLQ